MSQVSLCSDRYLQPHQAREREATMFEDLLGDSIERAFAQGIHTLPELVAYLNQTGPASENSEPWTQESYQSYVARFA